MSIAMEQLEIPEAARPIEQKALTIVPQAKALKVVDEPSKELAGLMFNGINEALFQIGEVFNPLVESAKEAKRKAEATRAAIVAQQQKFESPWQEAKIYVSGQLIHYKEEQDRKIEEERRRKEQEAIKAEMEGRKKAEEEAAALAATLEEAGAHDEAAQVVEEAIQKTESPIVVDVKIETPKVEIQGGTFRKTWRAEIFDLKALCLAVGQGRAAINLVDPNMPNLNRLAIALNENMRIPGVRAVSETSMSKGRK